jgi:hypothetical protein
MRKSLSRGALVVGALAVLAGGGAALAATQGQPAGRTYVPALGISVSQSKLRALEHSAPRALDPRMTVQKPVGHLRTNPVNSIPGRYLPKMRQGPFSPQMLQFTRAWQVSNGRTVVAVYAGVNPAQASQGRIIIFRQDVLAGTEGQVLINVAGSGALTITRAPLGVKAERSGETGVLTLRGANGVTYTLRLAANSIS